MVRQIPYTRHRKADKYDTHRDVPLCHSADETFGETVADVDCVYCLRIMVAQSSHYARAEIGDPNDWDAIRAKLVEGRWR